MPIPFVYAPPTFSFSGDCKLTVVPLFTGHIKFNSVSRVTNINHTLLPPVSYESFPAYAEENIFLPGEVENFNTIAIPEDEITYYPSFNNSIKEGIFGGYHWENGVFHCKTGAFFATLHQIMTSEECGNFFEYIADNIIPQQYHSSGYPFSSIVKQIAHKGHTFVAHTYWYVARGEIATYSIKYYFYVDSGQNCLPEGEVDSGAGGGGDGNNDPPPCYDVPFKIKITSIPQVRARVRGNICK